MEQKAVFAVDVALLRGGGLALPYWSRLVAPERPDGLIKVVFERFIEARVLNSQGADACQGFEKFFVKGAKRALSAAIDAQYAKDLTLAL